MGGIKRRIRREGEKGNRKRMEKSGGRGEGKMGVDGIN